MRFEERAEFDIVSDGITVWVNSSYGVCLGRFGKQGIDVHRASIEDQMQQGECLECTHAATTAEDWETFKVSMLRHHGIEVTDVHRPLRFGGSAL